VGGGVGGTGDGDGGVVGDRVAGVVADGASVALGAMGATVAAGTSLALGAGSGAALGAQAARTRAQIRSMLLPGRGLSRTHIFCLRRFHGHNCPFTVMMIVLL